MQPDQRWHTHGLCSCASVHRVPAGKPLPYFRVDALTVQATNSPNLIPLPAKYTIPNLPPNAGVLACLIYCGLYILLEPVAGSAVSIILLTSVAYANHLTNTYGMTANYWAAGAHVVSWIAQFIGHGKFEGRAPALLDNLFQAIFLAPLFVWLELLFSLGYRPELKNRLNKYVEQDIAKFKQSKVDGSVNGGPTTKSHTAAAGHSKKE